jgi:hypothetical protein
VLRGDLRSDTHGLGALGFRRGPCLVFLVLDRRPDKGCKQRVWLERLGFELRVELATEKPGVFGCLDDFHVVFVRGPSGDF